jgi:hypothetical protein
MSRDKIFSMSVCAEKNGEFATQSTFSPLLLEQDT